MRRGPLLRRAGIPAEFIVDVKDHPLLPGEHATEQWRRLAQITARGFSDARTCRRSTHRGHSAGLLFAGVRRAARDLQAWLRARGCWRLRR
jgi:hypothetical protein